MNLGEAHIIQGNALNLPLPDASVDLICTSPPYFGLRSYQDGGQHYDGQIGSEATPAEFLDALIAATREMVRVLKPSGSIFVNLGDKYSVLDTRIQSGKMNHKSGTDASAWSSRGQRKTLSGGIPIKSLMGMPWRYAIRCIDELGLILRAEIIWDKPNGLPESVTDRVRRSHEQWFHFTVQPRYFSAIDEIREEHLTPGGMGWAKVQKSHTTAGGGRGAHVTNEAGEGFSSFGGNPLGKLPGSVWTIPTQPLTVPPELGVDHFAAYPMEWPRRIIQGWTPNGICTECGQGRRPVTDKSYFSETIPNPDFKILPDTWKGSKSNPRERAPDGTFLPRGDDFIAKGLHTGRHRAVQRMGDGVQATITGYMCGCTPFTDHPGTGSSGPRYGDVMDDARGYVAGFPTSAVGGNSSLANRPKAGPWREYHYDQWTPAPTTPAVCLDPFGGTGTTALVAKALGRTGISIDLSNDYCRLAEWRCNDPRELAAALQIEKPEPIHPDQLDLFGDTL